MSALLHQATCVAIGDRAVLIEGTPGAGKSSIALALIDRGAVLVGDDGVLLEARADALLASAAPTTVGKLEVRNLGLFDFPTAGTARVCLAILLDGNAPRWIDAPEQCERGGLPLPLVRLWPGLPDLALRVELALARYGLG